MEKFNTIRFVIFGIICFMTLSFFGQVPNPGHIEAVAVYEAVLGASDDLPDDSVNYNINDAAIIDSMFTQIDVNVLRDCSRLEADCDGYVYVKFTDGTRQVYHLFATWSHFSIKGNRDACYYVFPPARELFKINAQ